MLAFSPKAPPKPSEILSRFIPRANWYQRQTEHIPFSIARLSVSHDADGAERLIMVWLKRGKPDEVEWKRFLDSATNLSSTAGGAPSATTGSVTKRSSPPVTGAD